MARQQAAEEQQTNPPDKRRQIAFRLPDTLCHRLGIQAAIERRSMQAIVQQAIEDYLTAHPKE